MSVSSAVVSFALVAGLVTVIPGLDTAMVLRSAIRDGPRRAFATAFGIGTGALLWGAAAAVGVSALLTTSTAAYTALRLAGAAYMIWLGGRLIWSSALRRTVLPASKIIEEQEFKDGGLLRAWRQGVLTNLLNPKVGAFYVAMLPQFIPEHTSPLAMGLLLALVHDLEGMLWFSALIFGATRMRALLQRRTAQRVVDGGTGSVLIGFGLKLSLSR